MATKARRRHRLVMYTHLLDRWWPATLSLALALGVLTAGLTWLPGLLPQYRFMMIEPWKMELLLGAGGLAVLVTIVLAALRKKAYIQVFEKHIRLATPFLRLNISLARMLRTYSEEIQKIYPPKTTRGVRREILQPLAARTVLVIEMTALPLPRGVMRLFLSPLFFPDRSARLALLVPDWMALSAELDSMLGRYQDGLRQKPGRPASSSLLSGLIDPHR